MAILVRIAAVLRLEESNDANRAAAEDKLDTARDDGDQASGGYVKVEDVSYNWGFRLTA